MVRFRPASITGVLLLLFLAPKSVHAYIDPGAGSYAFQVIVAFLVSALFALKIFWGKIRDYIKGLFGKQEES